MRLIATLSILLLLFACSSPSLSGVRERFGEIRVIDSFAVKESFDLDKGRMVSAYKGSFIIRENCFRPEFHALHEFFKYILVPVPRTAIYPLKSVESFCEVAVEVKDGKRADKKVEASGKYFKSGIGFSSKTEMLGFKFLHVDHAGRTYAVEITNVIGDKVVFNFKKYDHEKCGTGKVTDYPERRVIDYKERSH